jgi:hypothetical protein
MATDDFSPDANTPTRRKTKALDNTAYLNSPVPGPPTSAYDYGQSARAGVGTIASTVVDANKAVGGAMLDQAKLQAAPVVEGARGLADFARGAAGISPAPAAPAPTAQSNPAPAAPPVMSGVTSTAVSQPANRFSNVGAAASTQPGASSRASFARSPGDSSKGIDNLIGSGVGAVVNGVPTFTYDPKTGGNIGQPYVDRTSASPSTPYTGPEGGVASAATGRGGLAGTITQEQGVRAAGLGSLPGGSSTVQGGNEYDPEAAQRGAASDVASILSKDPRSTLGRAAWNAGVDLNHHGARSRSGSAPSEYQTAIGGLLGQVQSNLQAGHQGALATQAEGAAAGRQNSQQNFDLAKLNTEIAAKQGEQGTYQTDANGNLFRVSGTSATPVSGIGALPTQQGKGFTEAHAKLWDSLNNETKQDETGKTVPLSYDERVQKFNALLNNGTAGSGATTSKTAGTATATAKDGTKLKLSADGKSWVKANG